MPMLHPYQCLYYCSRDSQSEAGIIVGASGCFVHTFSAKNGRYLSTWPSLETVPKIQSTDQKNDNKPGVPCTKSYPQDESEQPTKRQKLSLTRDESGSSSAEIVVAGNSDNGESPFPQQTSKPPIIKLIGTSNGQEVVAVTGEDKCIRVFDLAADGTLSQLSERFMPKRPCAVILTPDDSTILCADKFGDVYSLPLSGQVYTSDAVNSAETNGTSGSSHHEQEQEQKPFAPSANSLTVHTKKNRDALLQQQKANNLKAEKKALNFEHEHLLGHVSLLTDVACVNLASPLHYKPRNYILTSDRDEHIRISRGIPQAHIIEGYCLGHTEFITKLCVPPGYPHLLISGGGDDYVVLWDWSRGQMLQRIDLKGLVTNLGNTHFGVGHSNSCFAEVKDMETEADSARKICVSNIQALEVPKGSSHHSRVEIIVTCERVPALFIFTLEEKGKMQLHTSIHTKSNVIDLTLLRKQTSVIYSMDTVHRHFSIDALSDDGSSHARSMAGSLSYCPDSNTWKENESLQANLSAAMRECADGNLNVPQPRVAKGRSLIELLYGLETLRKRGSENETDV